MNLSATINKLQQLLVARHHGIIKEIKLFEPSAGSWPYYYGYATVCNTGLLNQTISFRPPAAGIGATYDEAMINILGEAVERYCAAFQQNKTIITGNASSLARQYRLINSQDLAVYSTAQYQQAGFPYQTQQSSDIIEWQLTTDLNGQELLVPAAYVYLPFQSQYINLIPANSTGLACGPNEEHATLSALYEVIERDAYSLCWLYSGSPPKLCIDKQPHLIEKIPCFFHEDWKLEFFDLTGIEEIPVILCILYAPRSYSIKIKANNNGYTNCTSSFWYCHGVAAHSDPEIALIKSFQEAMLAYYFQESQWQHYMLDENSTQESRDPVNFHEHAKFYNTHPQLQKQCKFIHSGDTRDWGQSKGTSSSLEPGLNAIKRRLRHHHITAVAIDLTTRDLRNSGLSVSRVIIKGFNWLQGDNRIPTLGTKRARTPHLYYDYIKPFDNNEVHRRNIWPHSLG